LSEVKVRERERKGSEEKRGERGSCLDGMPFEAKVLSSDSDLASDVLPARLTTTQCGSEK